MVKTYLMNAAETIAQTYKRWFHTRSIIIMSEQKVRHLPINGHVQFAALIALVGSLCWSTYSTDRLLSARAVVKEQKMTIRSVASDRVNMNFGTVLRPVVASTPRRTVANGISLSEPVLAISGTDPKALYAHIAKLEQQVSALKTSNEAIIQHVKEKTASNIDLLENIIRRTGLDESELKKIALKNEKKSRSVMEEAKGGPFIPAELEELSDSEEAKELFSNLDELSTLRQIVGNLPLSRPMANATENSGFGHRVDPFTRRLAFHAGQDLSGPAGSKVVSTAAGRVISAGRNSAYGNAVDVDHGYGIVTRYAHLSRILVNEGDIVTTGQPIGVQGSTGRSTGAHLHYEVRYHNKPLNPKNFLSVSRYVSQN